jgi:hypothetical protein
MEEVREPRRRPNNPVYLDGLSLQGGSRKEHRRMLETLIADDDFPEDGKGVDANAETQVMPAFPDTEGPERRATGDADPQRRVLKGFLASLRMSRLQQSPYIESRYGRVSPLHGPGFD